MKERLEAEAMKQGDRVVATLFSAVDSEGKIAGTFRGECWVCEYAVDRSVSLKLCLSWWNVDANEQIYF